MNGEMKIEEKPFTAYKVYTGDGNQQRDGFIRGLSLEEVNDLTRFPLGPQRDQKGDFVWSYGINDGIKC